MSVAAAKKKGFLFHRRKSTDFLRFRCSVFGRLRLSVTKVGAISEAVLTIKERSLYSERDPVAVTAALYPGLLGLARILHCPDSAEDWVQETLIETLRRHPGYAGIADPSAYARTVLLRLVARGKVRARRLRLGLDGDAALALVGAEGPADVVGRLTSDEMLASLPLRQRACVYLNVVCGFSDRETAEALGCRASTVRSNVARALARLAREPAENEA
jgi:DNA-directed RNA polymerase specialized sigma24 family protein